MLVTMTLYSERGEVLRSPGEETRNEGDGQRQLSAKSVDVSAKV